VPIIAIWVINATALRRPAAKRAKRKVSARWQQRPENQDYFRGPENCQRVKGWRKHQSAVRPKKSRPCSHLQTPSVQWTTERSNGVLPLL
jgi:hypothetical protein